MTTHESWCHKTVGWDDAGRGPDCNCGAVTRALDALRAHEWHPVHEDSEAGGQVAWYECLTCEGIKPDHQPGCTYAAAIEQAKGAER